MLNTKGIGLGLSISKLIVNKFNGTIDFKSDDNGSNFYFTFEIEEIDEEQINQVDSYTEDSDLNNDSPEIFNMNVDILKELKHEKADGIFN